MWFLFRLRICSFRSQLESKKLFWDSIMTSTPWRPWWTQAFTSKTGPVFVFPRNHRLTRHASSPRSNVTLDIDSSFHLVLLLQQLSWWSVLFQQSSHQRWSTIRQFLVFRNMFEFLLIFSQQISLQPQNLWIFLTKPCYCSVDTELIYRNNRAKNQFSGFFTTVDVNKFLSFFSLLLNSPLSRALVARNTGWPLSTKLTIILSAVLSQSPSGLPE